ncbi:hypothetical protein LCGC14_1130060 [marine sediment metagenome]|uniref:Uncharacterized protein n=1 Tax=marine sediment metagenome TaxID=412755 RepID=A0A0F9M1A6_9ZZZZ
MGWKIAPNGQLVFMPDSPGGTFAEPGVLTDTDALIDAYFNRESEEAAGRAESTSLTGDVSISGTSQQTRTGTETVTSEETIRGMEFISQRKRVYIDVPTPEAFLDDFSNAFAGWGQDMLAAGMSPADLNILLDPGSGLMSGLLNEYMGNLAQRAARGEDLFDIAGLGGGEQFLGTRAGERSVTVTKAERKITRITRTQAEEILRQTDRDVTNENIQSVIDDDVQRQQESIATARDKTTATATTGTTKEDITRKEETTSVFAQTEELFRRPEVMPIFKFSPTDFLGERFDGDVGKLATFVQSKKGERARRQQTATGAPVAQARRV